MRNTEEAVNRIREFNRFYTVLQGFLNRNYLDSGYSVTETRILFELKQNPQASASQLIEQLRLDKGYISRLIRGFEQKGMVERHTSSQDGRARTIQLTARGRQETDRLMDITNRRLAAMIEPLDEEECGRLCAAMETIIKSFQTGTTLQEDYYGDK